ncbi:hypothetical protein SAMN02745121_08501 [Nannocystis exedens]|uniref:Uncharacterized protein n=1 Tax=Nannocystis exedens TaxID=54 RepID=A0A1I2IAU6_9BACT|nr:hypothetical protein [Nannocystis exedens]PCC74116.1 hypothetical protein NAEX_07205 [Nannocystis exedens]SFF38227.1 hypothetical protein SAMN02745121_08501 [Nannocystis exedens]
MADELDPRARALLAAYRRDAGPSPAATERLLAAVRRSAAAAEEAQVVPLRRRGASRQWVGVAVVGLVAAALAIAFRLSPRRLDADAEAARSAAALQSAEDAASGAVTTRGRRGSATTDEATPEPAADTEPPLQRPGASDGIDGATPTAGAASPDPSQARDAGPQGRGPASAGGATIEVGPANASPGRGPAHGETAGDGPANAGTHGAGGANGASARDAGGGPTSGGIAGAANGANAGGGPKHAGTTGAANGPSARDAERAGGARTNAGTAGADMAPTSPASAAGDALAQELAIVRAVNDALAGGSAEQALARLDDYQRRFPGGALREEAAALRAVALCAAGRTEGATEAAAFLRAHPGSLSAERVRRACGVR